MKLIRQDIRYYDFLLNDNFIVIGGHFGIHILNKHTLEIVKSMDYGYSGGIINNDYFCFNHSKNDSLIVYNFQNQIYTDSNINLRLLNSLLINNTLFCVETDNNNTIIEFSLETQIKIEFKSNTIINGYYINENIRIKGGRNEFKIIEFKQDKEVSFIRLKAISRKHYLKDDIIVFHLSEKKIWRNEQDYQGLVAYNWKTGQKLWELDLPYSSYFVKNEATGKFYTLFKGPYTNDSATHLYELDVEQGKLSRHKAYETFAYHYLFEYATIYENKLYVQSNNKTSLSPTGVTKLNFEANLLCFDLESFELESVTKIMDKKNKISQKSGYGKPVFEGNRMYVIANGGTFRVFEIDKFTTEGFDVFIQ